LGRSAETDSRPDHGRRVHSDRQVELGHPVRPVRRVPRGRRVHLVLRPELACRRGHRVPREHPACLRRQALALALAE